MRTFPLLTAVFLAATVTPAPLAVAAPKCTITGTKAADVLKGTTKGDVICGLGGNDTILGLGGNDTILGLGGNDVLIGGPGVDKLDGGAGNDVLRGDAGKDTLKGGTGKDRMEAQSGDKFTGGAGVDTVSFATSPTGVVIHLPHDMEHAIGSRFNDKLTGNAQRNQLDGGRGNDTLNGKGGADTVKGGAGNDRLESDVPDAKDVVDGGAGTDLLSFENASAGVTVTMPTTVEQLTGSPHADTLTGNVAANMITGGDGADVIDGAGGGDSVSGDSGSDTISFASSTGGVTIDLSAGTATGSVTLTGVENATGSPGADTITGTSEVNILRGAEGDDTIRAGAGNDDLGGGAGSDTLSGDVGNDTLSGGPGADKLDGGAGVNPCRGDDDGFDLQDVFVGGSCEDVTAPKIISVTRVPEVIDTRLADQTVTYSVRLRDDLSGFSHCRDGQTYGNGPAPFGVTLMPSSGALGQQVMVGSTQGPNFGEGCTLYASGVQSITAHDVSADGRAMDVTWVVDVKVGRFSRLGPWTPITNGHVADILGNGYTGSSSAVQAAFPGFTNVA